MNEETTVIEKTEKTVSGQPITHDSQAFGISIRAYVAILLVLTICTNHLVVTMATLYSAIWVEKDFQLVGSLTTVGEPLYSLVLLAVGFYFGQKPPSAKS